MIYFDEEKQAYAYEIPNYIAKIEDTVWNKYAGSNKWDIVDGVFVDITDTAEYKKQKRIKEIEIELQEADDGYEELINTPVTYINGFKYKPKYVQESYILLLCSNLFPVTIWDSEEKHPVSMNKDELTQLSLFLKEKVEGAFQARKETRKALIEEMESLG